MNLSALWAKIPQPAKTAIFSVLTGGAVLGTSEYISYKPEVVVPISAGRQQLIDTGHIDRKVLKERLNQTVKDVFKEQGFCDDPVVAEKDISETVAQARCKDSKAPEATPN